MTYRRLAAIALLVLGTAAVAAGKKPTDPDPCAAKAMDAQEKCSSECFKVDPNKADQKPTQSQMNCMSRCQEKSGKASAKCFAEQQAKTDAKENKGKQAEQIDAIDAL